MKIFATINLSPLHLFNSVPIDSNLCYQNKIHYFFQKNKIAINSEHCLAKEKILILAKDSL